MPMTMMMSIFESETPTASDPMQLDVAGCASAYEENGVAVPVGSGTKDVWLPRALPHTGQRRAPCAIRWGPPHGFAFTDRSIGANVGAIAISQVSRRFC